MKRNKKIILMVMGMVLVYIPLFISRNIWHQGYDDYYLHNMFADRYWSGEGFDITHPVYAIIVGGFAKLFHLRTAVVSVPIMILAEVLAVYFGSKLLMLLDHGAKEREYYWGISILLNMIQPILWPGYMISPCSANGYVSPTQILCKPFTIWVMYLFFQMYQDRKYPFRIQGLLCVIMAVSSYIKPLFSMAFIPAMGLVLLIDEGILILKSHKKIVIATKDYIIRVWPLFINGLILLVQYAQNASLQVPEDLNVGWGSEAPIRFGLFYAWGQVVPSVAFNILFAYALPILVLIIYIRRKERDEILHNFGKLSLSYGFVSFFYISCLYQEGFATDLNFRNAWIITFTYVYAMTLLIVCRWNREQKKHKRMEMYGVNGLLVVHLLCGVAMIVKNCIM